MKRTVQCLLAAAGLAFMSLGAISPAQAATYPNAAEAITLKNAINNNTVAGRNVGNNNTTIATYLPRMADCKPVFQVAVNSMNAEIAYIAGGGTDTVRINAYRSQVNSALDGGTACSQPAQRPAGDVFNANGVKFTNTGWPTLTFVNAVVTTSNNFPANLRARQVAAYNAGWRFYIFRTPDDFKASALYTSMGITQAEYDGLKVRSAATSGIDKVQIIFQNFYTVGGDQLVPFTANKPTYVETHEMEHVNDFRLGSPSSNDAGFVAAYNLGVQRYNAATTKDQRIGDNFVTNPQGVASGRSELFAELATYWDTGHWSVSGVPADMAGLYSSPQVLNFFSEAWTYMQQKKQAGTW